MSAVLARKATFFIADALFGAGSHTWDSKDAAWGTDDFNDVFAFARQDTLHNPDVRAVAVVCDAEVNERFALRQAPSAAIPDLPELGKDIRPILLQPRHDAKR
eukprot:jgi/Tetstr1/458481/TSEL_004335.t1